MRLWAWGAAHTDGVPGWLQNWSQLCPVPTVVQVRDSWVGELDFILSMAAQKKELRKLSFSWSSRSGWPTCQDRCTGEKEGREDTSRTKWLDLGLWFATAWEAARPLHLNTYSWGLGHQLLNPFYPKIWNGRTELYHWLRKASLVQCQENVLKWSETALFGPSQ